MRLDGAGTGGAQSLSRSGHCTGEMRERSWSPPVAMDVVQIPDTGGCVMAKTIETRAQPALPNSHG